METLVTAQVIAKTIGTNVQRVYAICRTDPSFPKVEIGLRQYRFAPSAVQRWIERGGSKQGGKHDDKVN